MNLDEAFKLSKEYIAWDCDLLVTPTGDIVGWVGARKAVHDKLTAHCMEHFREALAALKEEHENHNDHHDAGCGGTRLCPVCKLLVKLEGVK